MRWLMRGVLSLRPGAPRVDHTATLLPDGRVLVVGGNGAGLTATTAAEVYDPAADRWQATGAMSALRAHHTATLLPDGRVLAVGGLDPTDESFTILATADIFDPTTNAWQAALHCLLRANIILPRCCHTARCCWSAEEIAAVIQKAPISTTRLAIAGARCRGAPREEFFTRRPCCLTGV
jgi:deoxycytidylate deaminase